MTGESLILPPSDITLPTRSHAEPVKGKGESKSNYPIGKALVIGVTRTESISNFPETMAHALEKSITINKDYLGGQIKKLGEVTIASIIPRPERITTLIIGQKGGGDPCPHVSIPISALHGALCSKTTISGSSPPRENSLTKVICTLGRNGDQGTMLGAKVPDETLLKKGTKLAKVRE